MNQQNKEKVDGKSLIHSYAHTRTSIMASLVFLI